MKPKRIFWETAAALFVIAFVCNTALADRAEITIKQLKHRRRSGVACR